MSDFKNVWNNYGNQYLMSTPSKEFEKLDNGVYIVGFSMKHGFYLNKTAEQFNFNYKIYGLETNLIERTLKTYEYNNSNLGVLLNGVKGTGKTVTSKIIANRLNQPIIVINSDIDGVTSFLNKIPQDVTIFIDEYEKIYGESSKMLTIMDGALTSKYRRLFLLTTNNLHVDDNLIERPSRIRYLKTFGFLTPDVILEIIDDLLIHKDLKDACFNFISTLKTITVDIVKAILNEVNIHNENPEVFADVFNVKKVTGKYNIKVKNDDGKFSTFVNDVETSQRPLFNHRTHVGRYLYINGVKFGRIKHVLNWTTIELEPERTSDNLAIGFDEPIVLSFEDANMINNVFAYNGYEKVEESEDKSFLYQEILKKIKHYKEFEIANE